MKKALIITLSALAANPAYADDLIMFDLFKNPYVKTQKQVQENFTTHKRREAERKARYSRKPVAIKRSKSYASGRIAPSRATGRVSSNRVR